MFKEWIRTVGGVVTEGAWSHGLVASLKCMNWVLKSFFMSCFLFALTWSSGGERGGVGVLGFGWTDPLSSCGWGYRLLRWRRNMKETAIKESEQFPRKRDEFLMSGKFPSEKSDPVLQEDYRSENFKINWLCLKCRGKLSWRLNPLLLWTFLTAWKRWKTSCELSEQLMRRRTSWTVFVWVGNRPLRLRFRLQGFKSHESLLFQGSTLAVWPLSVC